MRWHSSRWRAWAACPSPTSAGVCCLRPAAAQPRICAARLAVLGSVAVEAGLSRQLQRRRDCQSSSPARHQLCTLLSHVPRRPRALLDVAPEDLKKDVTAQEGEQQDGSQGGKSGQDDNAPARPLDQEPVSPQGAMQRQAAAEEQQRGCARVASMAAAGCRHPCTHHCRPPIAACPPPLPACSCWLPAS